MQNGEKKFAKRIQIIPIINKSLYDNSEFAFLLKIFANYLIPSSIYLYAHYNKAI